MKFFTWSWLFWLEETLSIDNFYILHTLLPALLGFATSLAICLLIVWTQRWHGAWSSDYLNGVQKVHAGSTPRVGGAAIVLGLLVASSQHYDTVEPLLDNLLLAGSAAFIFGFIEDLTGRVSVRLRFLATLASGIFFIWLLKHSISFVLLPTLNWVMQFSLVSILFTLLAMGGLAQSINIIDGLNGLAGLVSVFAFAGFALIAHQVGDYALMSCSLTLAAAVLGFFCANWPFGKIFLGDGGAYFIGFALAAMAVLLVERNVPVSDFAALLICVHPVTEVLYSMYRRKMTNVGITHPDRLHFHTLLKMRYIRRWFAQRPRVFRNSIAGLMMSGFTLVAVVLASLSHASVPLSAFFFVVMVVAYIAFYLRMVRYRWTWTRKTRVLKHRPDSH